ncbi:MAG: TraR/DksA C4-type zinc finger protein [Patescibacteria group bacterium]
MIDKKKIKEELEKEKNLLSGQMNDMGKLNPETGQWETQPEAQDFPEADANDQADRFEDYESKSSMMRDLQKRWNNILNAIKNINKTSFGKCEICKKDIEAARMKANPAARTCKKHINE